MRTLSYLFQPGVLLTALVGTLLQVALALANAHNLAGVADMAARYGLSGQVASGGLVAALTGLCPNTSRGKCPIQPLELRPAACPELLAQA